MTLRLRLCNATIPRIAAPNPDSLVRYYWLMLSGYSRTLLRRLDNRERDAFAGVNIRPEREGTLLRTERRPVTRMTTQDVWVLAADLAAMSMPLPTRFPGGQASRAPDAERVAECLCKRRPEAIVTFSAGIAVFIAGILSLDEKWWEIRQG